MEGQGRSRKVKEGHGWSFPITGLTFQVRKVSGGWWVVSCRIIVSAPVPALTWYPGNLDNNELKEMNYVSSASV